MSKKDKKAGDDGLIPSKSTVRAEELLRAPLVEPPAGIEVTSKLLEGAVVAQAMELQKTLGMPYHEPQVAVEQMGLPWDKVKAVLPYWKGLVSTLNRGPGRPKKTVDDRMSHPGSLALLNGMRDFIFANPGCVRPGPSGQRYVYSGGFREHMLQLLGPGGPGEGMTIAQAAYLTSIPANTLTAWKGRKRRKGRRKPK